MGGFLRDGRASAVNWFALAACVVCAASLAGAHGLAWLTKSGRISIVAARPAPSHVARAPENGGVDDTPTGAIRPATALMIRIR